MESNHLIITIVISFFSLMGGGFGLAILQSIINRKKNKVEITTQSIQTALDLEKLSKERYLEEVERNNKINEKLGTAEQLIYEIKRDLEMKNRYIELLMFTLKKHNIEIPKVDD